MSQRQEYDSVIPFAVVTAFGKQKDVLNDRTYQIPLAHNEHAAHGFAAADATIGKVGDRSNIVSQESAAVFRSPSKYRWIIGAIKPHILNANDIDMSCAKCESTQDVVIEILVREKSKHGVL
jgi:hypothetical protein